MQVDLTMKQHFLIWRLTALCGGKECVWESTLANADPISYQLVVLSWGTGPSMLASVVWLRRKLKPPICDCVVLSWLACLGRIGMCGLVGEDVPFEFQEHHDCLPTCSQSQWRLIPTSVRPTALNYRASSLCSERLHAFSSSTYTNTGLFFFFHRSQGSHFTTNLFLKPLLLFVFVLLSLNGPCFGGQREEK